MEPRQGRTISTATAADLAGVSRQTIRDWAHQGLFPEGVVVRLHPRGALMGKRNAFVEWLDEQAKRPIYDGDQALLFRR